MVRNDNLVGDPLSQLAGLSYQLVRLAGFLQLLFALLAEVQQVLVLVLNLLLSHGDRVLIHEVVLRRRQVGVDLLHVSSRHKTLPVVHFHLPPVLIIARHKPQTIFTSDYNMKLRICWTWNWKHIQLSQSPLPRRQNLSLKIHKIYWKCYNTKNTKLLLLRQDITFHLVHCIHLTLICCLCLVSVHVLALEVFLQLPLLFGTLFLLTSTIDVH